MTMDQIEKRKSGGWQCLVTAAALCVAGTAAAAGLPPAACTEPGKLGWYVPASAGNPSDLHGIRLSGYEAMMARLDEPSLACGDVPEQAYRFAWDPSFWPAVSVRVWRDGQGTAWVASASIMMDYPPNPVPKRRECPLARPLDAAEWKQVEQVFSALQGTVEADPHEGGLDGESWWLESRIDDRQRLLNRWQPKDPAVRRAGSLMMRLGGCDIGRTL